MGLLKLLHTACASQPVIQYAHGSKECCLDSAVPTCRDLLFLPFKTTETLVKSCAKLVWLSDCGKVFKRSRTQATIGPQDGRSAIKLETSFRLIQILRTLTASIIASALIITLAPPRMPSTLPVEFQTYSLIGWKMLVLIRCRFDKGSFYYVLNYSIICHSLCP